ncbi:MAG: ATP-binding protein [Bacteroidales bacterium]
MLFSQIIGHSELKQRLINAIQQGRISHAQMFVARQGTGGLPMALAYAQYIMCEQPTPNDSCGVCSTCHKMSNLIHPDLHFAFPVNSESKKDKNSDAFLQEFRKQIIENPYLTEQEWYEAIEIGNKLGVIGVDEAGAILAKLNLKAFEGKFKIMLIWLPERMNEEASNKLLKLIEEPTGKTLFLLVAENTRRILKTILSRTQILNIPQIEVEALVKMLHEQMQVPTAEAKILAKVAQGSVVEARSIIHQNEQRAQFSENFKNLMRLSYASNPKNILALLDLAEELASHGRENQKNFLLYAMQMVRENFALNQKATDAFYLLGDEAEFSQKFSPFINKDNVQKLYEELNLAMQHILRNGNPKIIFTDLALKLVKLILPLKAN